MTASRRSASASEDALTSAELTLALQRLSAGEAISLPVGGDADRAALAQAFNQVSDQFAKLATSRPASALLSEPVTSGNSLASSYIAVLGLEGFSSLRLHIGPTVAEHILEVVAQRLRDLLPTARLGRIGWTSIEFAFAAEGEDAALRQLESLRPALLKPIVHDGRTFELDAVIGIASGNASGDTAIDCATLALAQARAKHIKVSAFREQDHADAAERRSLMLDLYHAIAQDELFLVYQPKLSARTDKIEEAEALIRWRHAERGLVPPDKFIGLAEETGLINDLTRWVLSRAIRDQDGLAARGLDIEIHVNLSGRLVTDEKFADWALETLASRPRGVIGFEITETAVIDDPERALRHLRSFAEAGIKIGIDDYGSGLSSLAYLKQLPAHELKIDRMFISGLTSSHLDPLLVRSTIDLAHALEMKVTAEGVDNPMTLALLRRMGCDLIQGYLISPPLEVEAFEDFLKRGEFLSATKLPSVLGRRQEPSSEVA